MEIRISGKEVDSVIGFTVLAAVKACRVFGEKFGTIGKNDLVIKPSNNGIVSVVPESDGGFTVKVNEDFIVKVIQTFTPVMLRQFDDMKSIADDIKMLETHADGITKAHAKANRTVEQIQADKQAKLDKAAEAEKLAKQNNPADASTWTSEYRQNIECTLRDEQSKRDRDSQQ